MTTFSLAALTVLELAPPEMIELAARCGYEKVGLRLLPATPGGIAYRLMDDAALLRETLRRLQATGGAGGPLRGGGVPPGGGGALFSPLFLGGGRPPPQHTL